METNTKLLRPGRSIQTKLILVIALMLVISLLVNLFIFTRINTMVSEIDSVFASNVTIQELSDTLEKVQSNVFEYLNTRGSEVLEDYYRYAEDYRQLLGKLNNRNCDSRILMLEKNIRGMSESFLSITDETVQAKRGRNVERYKESYEQETLLYQYINHHIYELNSMQFEQNSENYTLLLSVMRVLEAFSLIVIVVIFLLAIIIMIMIIRAMISPLVSLSDAARQVADGHFDVEVPKVNTNDEIGIVNRTFNQMLESIRAYIVRTRTSLETQARMKERELTMETRLKEAQLKFLQAQINPHFMFNSLNAGAQLAMMEDADATSVFLEKMADFFRYNVKMSAGDIRSGNTTLAEEIEMVDSYIYILNVRFAGDITYEKEIEDGIGDISMPGMILQPLVENAINHGIRDMLDQGVITLRAEEADGFVQVMVSDNGIGMTKEQIEAVLGGSKEDKEDKAGKADKADADTQEEQPGAAPDGSAPDGSAKAEQVTKESDSTGIGLMNVISRLQLFYDRDDLVSIYSEGIGHGTEVTVLLPIERQV